jgi:hypothetical protein
MAKRNFHKRFPEMQDFINFRGGMTVKCEIAKKGDDYVWKGVYYHEDEIMEHCLSKEEVSALLDSFELSSALQYTSDKLLQAQKKGELMMLRKIRKALKLGGKK